MQNPKKKWLKKPNDWEHGERFRRHARQRAGLASSRAAGARYEGDEIRKYKAIEKPVKLSDSPSKFGHGRLSNIYALRGMFFGFVALTQAG